MGNHRNPFRSGLITCHWLLITSTLRRKSTASCHPERSEGSRAILGQILHCVQNDKPGAYFCPLALEILKNIMWSSPLSTFNVRTLFALIFNLCLVAAAFQCPASICPVGIYPERWLSRHSYAVSKPIGSVCIQSILMPGIPMPGIPMPGWDLP